MRAEFCKPEVDLRPLTVLTPAEKKKQRLLPQEIALTAVRAKGKLLQHAGPSLRADKDIVLAAVRSAAPSFCSLQVRTDFHIVSVSLFRNIFLASV